MHSRHSEAPHVARAPGRSYFDPAGSCTSSILSSIGHRSRPTPLALQFTDGPLCARKSGRRSSLESPSVPLGPKHGKIELDFRQFLQVVDGNDSFVVDISSATIRRGQPSRGRCSDIYCSPFLSLFSISFVPLVPPCLLLFFFFPLFVLSSLSQTRSTAPSFFIYVIARHSRDRCRDALAITFICAGNWAREPNLADREIIALGYQVCIYEREKFERVVARSSDSALTFHLSRGCIFRFHEMYTVSSRLRTRKRISRKRTLVVPSLT